MSGNPVYRALAQIAVYSLAMDDTATPCVAPPRGMTTIGIFFFFGALMAFLAGTSLAKRGTFLDRMWVLNPHAYDELTPLGRRVGLFFLLLAAALLLAGVGWFKRRRWGWQLAVTIIGIQVIGDATNIFLGRPVHGVFGVAIAGALLFYITRPYMRHQFCR
jgi:hypothetical protein